MPQLQVRIENSAHGCIGWMGEKCARKLVARGRARFIAPCVMRWVEDEPRNQAAVAASNEQQRRQRVDGAYDGIKTLFAAELPNIPVVQASKLIRQERSSRDWSYSAGVRRYIPRPDSPDRVAELRA